MRLARAIPNPVPARVKQDRDSFRQPRGWAAMEARRRAVEQLSMRPAHILVDRTRSIVGCRVPQTAVVDGDALSASVAAASVVAKVTRDSLMEEYAQLYSGYGFERNKGYV